MTLHFGVSFSYLPSVCLPFDTYEDYRSIISVRSPDTSIIDMFALLLLRLSLSICSFFPHPTHFERMIKLFLPFRLKKKESVCAFVRVYVYVYTVLNSNGVEISLLLEFSAFILSNQLPLSDQH